MIFLLTFAFGLLKLQDLVKRKNPLLSANTEDIGIDETYSLGNGQFMMAFAMHKFHGSILDFDARYVRWIVRTWEDQDGERAETFYPLHLCTKADLNRFYEPESEETAQEVKRLHESDNLFCLHPKTNEFELKGSWLKTGDSTTYDIWLTACGSSYTLFDGT